jgi:RNA polymerase sigma factor (sigma-70 family)
VALFRAGNDEAFRVIHDRYRQRLFAYTRQMLPGSRQDAEDALQDVFVRAYGGLRANDRAFVLRAWLYRVAHNRCIDELRRPAPPAPEVLELVRPPATDPIAEAEQRESLRRLIADIRRLPDQQRSALLMRELGGMTYCEVSDALSVSVPAVKSLLVRARVGLAQAAEARDASCVHIREDLIVAHDRGVRPSGLTRRHIRDCAGCTQFRGQLRGTSKQFAALLPAIGPLGIAAKLLGFGGGGGAAASSGAAASGGAAAVGTGGTVASVGVLATGAGHVATLLAAAVVTAGGAVEIQHTIAQPARHHARHAHVASIPSAPASPVARHAPASYAVAPSAAPVAAAAPARPAVTQPRHAVGSMKSKTSVPATSSRSAPGQLISSSGPASAGGVPSDPTGTGGTGTLPGDSTGTGSIAPPTDGVPGSTGGATGTPPTGTGPIDPGTIAPTGSNGSTGSTTGSPPPTDSTAGSASSTGSGGSSVKS